MELNLIGLGKSSIIRLITSNDGSSCLSNNDLSMYRILFIGKVMNFDKN